jgi:meso-butanediol dehydrogenase / (S,S)-butanediol dehydrogenase / diacetyl reductase
MPGKAAVAMRDLAHVAEVDDVALVPDARRRIGVLVGLRMDRTEFREDDAPAAFGFHAAQVRLGAGALGTGPRAMRGLPKAIARLLGSDLDRFEQHVVFGVSSHGAPTIMGVTGGRPRGAGPPTMKFVGKVALVTGSTTGIGAGCARVFAESGAAVMVSGRDAARGLAVAAEIAAPAARRNSAPPTCVRRVPASALVAATVAALGGLDILVNNAGILYTANALDTSDEQWLDTMAVNVNALFFMSRAAVRQMRRTGRGAIVNIASEWGLNGEPNHVAYCASKGAVLQITRCMALDHARDNIRVNSVCPGEIHTRMVDEIWRSAAAISSPSCEELAAGIPMRRLAQPVEVARCVAFLASDLASYVTGANLPVDGGNDATAGPYP